MAPSKFNLVWLESLLYEYYFDGILPAINKVKYKKVENRTNKFQQQIEGGKDSSMEKTD